MLLLYIFLTEFMVQIVFYDCPLFIMFTMIFVNIIAINRNILMMTSSTVVRLYFVIIDRKDCDNASVPIFIALSLTLFMLFLLINCVFHIDILHVFWCCAVFSMISWWVMILMFLRLLWLYLLLRNVQILAADRF